MKVLNILPLALLTFLAGCATQEVSLNDTLPKLTAQALLPAVTANQYCNAQMDSDMLFGTGLLMYEDREYVEAKTCLVMAAPKYPRAFCYLSAMVHEDDTLTSEQSSTLAFNYKAYAATKNDWCAEYGIFEVFEYGTYGVKKDPAIALRWLERSSLHGYPEAQKELIKQYEKRGDLTNAYAWTKIMANADDAQAGNPLKNRMTPVQLAEAAKRYSELVPQVASKAAMAAEEREEDVARYSAQVYQNYPDTFNGLSSAERYDYVKQAIHQAMELPFTKGPDHVVGYIVINRAAQLKLPGARIENDQRIVTLMEDKALSVDEIVESGLLVVNKFY
ncbi:MULTISPECIES: sel1 repeat family protein [Pseudomonas]|uniref:Sel1 repeat family protein n=1 Tax=Pseudomonas koreensis TaxID=198620 RepID=A0AA94JGC8_9PSED|nr:sel1 repeat family protein [Pseudomonas koreensis]RVD76172.1 hypothetical protein A9HBioS_3835 [Pseudomonas koreensis]